MNLQEFRSAEKLSLRGLSRLLGIPYSSITDYLYGHRRPTAERIVLISERTRGSVCFADWYPAPSPIPLPDDERSPA